MGRFGVLIWRALLAMKATAPADPISFETDPVGSAPAGWTKTGTGVAKWSVEADPTAPSKQRV